MKTSSILLSTDPLEELIERLIPASLGLRVHQLAIASDELTLLLASSQSQARCPVCGQASAGVHSRYTRSLQDLPWDPLRHRLRVQVHRFFCQNPACLRRIFTEPLPEFAEPYARRTNRLREALLALGWALGGEAGARQCAAHAMPICAATLLNRARIDVEHLPARRLGSWGSMIGLFKPTVRERCSWISSDIDQSRFCWAATSRFWPRG